MACTTCGGAHSGCNALAAFGSGGSALLPANSLSIFKGTSRTLELHVIDSTGKCVNITGATIVFTLKKCAGDQFPIIQKTSASILQVEITDPKGGVARIYLNPADTMNLDPGDYVYDVWIILASGKRYVLIPESTFTVLQGVTVLPP